ncbi:LysM peptidoglycan-binding domain-containing protein [Marinifaba aquimaris]|uniref:LysM peptidoglycan-binding domain-containing protein n=1 Tax=Marinifaba aquimaris TaxID=2741323 RepID=UPI001FE289E4|nr:LysM peptidoglycan-binding domain-containing protein [Marinifaba aquimaris]
MQLSRSYFPAFLAFFSLVLSGCKSFEPLGETAEKKTNKAPVKANAFIAAEYEVGDYAHLDVALGQKSENADESEIVFGNIWRRIQSQLTFDIPENRRLAIQRSWYARHPDYLNRVSKRAEPFMYLIVEEIEKRDLPMELAILPIVESAFDPFAYSHGRASGLWQFVPETGERFGLKQNWWYDGRRDVLAATNAALDYLEFLNKKFDGDWLHALAAYNSGEGRVQRAIRKNFKAGENTDFWSLDLPKETDAYVPKLLALADLIKRPEHYNISIRPIANIAVLESVSAPSQIDLALAAKLADMNVNELHALNPAYNRWATSPKGPHNFLLPIDKAELFNKNITDVKTNDLVSWKRYKIKRGDSLGKIANKHKITVDAIQTANKIKGNNIRAGQYLLIPTASASLDEYKLSANQRLTSKQQKIAKQKQKAVHTVKSGDTFWDISRQYKVNVRELAKWNGMAPGDPIFPGQKLTVYKKVSKAEMPKSTPTTRKVNYKVRSGDSLARIANRFNVSIKEIESWNKLNRNKYLQPGQMLKLYVDVTNIKG